MIKSITLNNFQSHKDTTVNFCDGINAIVGLSDSGKTSILRAIDWVVNNNPSGEEFISSWSKETSVSIILNSGVVVKRGRSPSDNYYMIDKQIFKAFGVYVPEEVKNVINMEPINIEKQLDAPFLLGSSPGEVAQILNQIVDLGGIDHAISNIRKEKMRVDQTYRTESTRWKEKVDELRQYDYLEAMERDVNSAVVLTQNIKNAREEVGQIQKTIKNIDFQKNIISQYNYELMIEPQLAHCQKLYDELKTGYRKMTTLKTIIRTHKTNYTAISKYNKILINKSLVKTADELLNKIKINRDKSKQLESLLENYTIIKEKTAKNIKIISNHQQVTKCLKIFDKIKSNSDTSKIINTLLSNIKVEIQIQSEYDTITKNMEGKYTAMFPDICPLCGK